MVTTVKLQSPFEYSFWVIVIAALILAAAIGLLVYLIMRLVRIFQKLPPRPAARKIELNPYVLGRMKEEYVGKIENIAGGYKNGAITKRDGYQRLSAIIREFVHEATGINVESLVKSEIKALGIRNLDKLMEEYYVPEFAEDEKAEHKDLISSCVSAMGVIKSWS